MVNSPPHTTASSPPRQRRGSVRALLGAVLVIGLVFYTALRSAQAQPPPQDTAKPQNGAPIPNATGAVSSTATLPPGHPPVRPRPSSDKPGHPSGSVMAPRLPAQSSVTVDPKLPRNTVEVHLLDAQAKPLARGLITLSILHQGKAGGRGPERIRRSTDKNGIVRFESLSIAPEVSYRVSSNRGPAVFSSAPFNLAADSRTGHGGMRVELFVYPSTSRIEQTRLGVQSVVVLEIKENAIAVGHMLAFFNFGPTAFVPENLNLRLPAGYRALTGSEAMSNITVRQVAGGLVQLRGTFGPGRTSLSFSYRVPLLGEPEQSLSIALPPRVAQSRIIAAIAPPMQLTVAGYPPGQPTRDANGHSLLVTERQLGGPGSGSASLQITLRGLPRVGWGRTVALGLAIALIVFGAWYLVCRKRGRFVQHLQADLEQARDLLLEQLVWLESAKGTASLSAGRYEKTRNALLDALSRIVERLGELEQKRDQGEASGG